MVPSMKKEDDDEWICTGCTREGDAYAARANDKTLWIRMSSGFSAEINPSVAYRTCRRKYGIEFATDASSAMEFMKRRFESGEVTVVDGQLAFESTTTAIRIESQPFASTDAWMKDVFVEQARRARAEREAMVAATAVAAKTLKGPMSPDSTSSIGRWILEGRRDRPRLARLAC